MTTTFIISIVVLVIVIIAVPARKTLAYFVFAAGLAVVVAFLGLIYRAIKFTL